MPDWRADWPTTKKRWLAFWDHGCVDRPVLQLAVPRRGAAAPPPALARDHEIPEKRHADAEHIYRWGLHVLEQTSFWAEGLPLLHSGSSVGQALYYGCAPRFTAASAWAEPLPGHARQVPALDPGNRWVAWHRDALRLLAARCGGRYFMLPTFGNHAGDTLALIRGAGQLMLDALEDPAWTRGTDLRVGRELTGVINERFADIEAAGMDGHMNDAGMWAPRRPWDIHCDLSCMVSTRVFRDVFWPSQREVIDQSDGYNYYHVDGPGVLNHLDFILEEPGIQAIQWVPGVGRFHCLKYVGLYRKILARGKSIQVIADHGDVVPFLKRVPPDGVCMLVTGCPDEDAAARLVDQVE